MFKIFTKSKIDTINGNINDKIKETHFFYSGIFNILSILNELNKYNNVITYNIYPILTKDLNRSYFYNKENVNFLSENNDIDIDVLKNKYPIDLFEIKSSQKNIIIKLNNIYVKRKFYTPPSKLNPFYYYCEYEYLIENEKYILNIKINKNILYITYEIDNGICLEKDKLDYEDKNVSNEKTDKFISIFGKENISIDNLFYNQTDNIGDIDSKLNIKTSYIFKYVLK